MLGETRPEQEWSNGTEFSDNSGNSMKRGCTQNVFLNFRKLFPEFLPFHSVSDRKSRNFRSNGKRPLCSVQPRCQLILEIVIFIQELLWSNSCAFRDAISVGSQSPWYRRRVFQHLSSTGSNCFQQHVIFWMNMNVCGVQAVSI